MTHQTGTLPEPRPLSTQERALVTWLLEHGEPDARAFLPQLDQATVAEHCRCGCASIDFAIAGKRPTTFGMHVLSDYQWKDAAGHLFGVFVFEQDDLLAGLELWSVEGVDLPPGLPAIDSLIPFDTPV